MNSRRAVAVGSAAVVLLGGGVAVAATSHGGPSGRGGPQRGDDRPAPAPAPQGFGGGGFQHGQFTSGSAAKGFTTYDEQNGTVTAYTAGSSITVTSADGFSATYAVTSSTKTTFPKAKRRPHPAASASASPSATASLAAKALAVGDSVSVTAKVSGDTATATRVDDHGTKPATTPTASATS